MVEESKQEKYLHPRACGTQLRAPTAHHPLLRVLPEGPTPVMASLTGAESDVGENLIAQIFHTTIF